MAKLQIMKLYASIKAREIYTSRYFVGYYLELSLNVFRS